MAVTVELTSGASATGIDLQLTNNRVRTYHVRGVITGVNGQPSANTEIRVVSRVPGPNVTIAGTRSAADGSFDIEGVFPGSYLLTESTGVGVLPIEVGNADVEVSLAVSNGWNINGRIVMEGAAPAADANARGIQVRLSRDPDIVGMQAGGPRFNPPSTDAGFMVGGVGPGDYRVSVLPMLNQTGADIPDPTGARLSAYVKSIRLGNADVLAGGLHLWGPPTGALEIVVAWNGGAIEGRVVDDRRSAVANAVVVLAPDAANRLRRDLYKTARTDQTGRFQLNAVAPGDYSLFAWDDVEPGAWLNADYMRSYESRGRFVRVGENGNETVELNVMTR
jgi:hypothetical protein